MLSKRINSYTVFIAPYYSCVQREITLNVHCNAYQYLKKLLYVFVSFSLHITHIYAVQIQK